MRLKTDLFALLAGRVCIALIALATLRAVTTLLSPEEYGELALLVALQMFCGLILINPVGQYINLHTHAWWDDGTLLPRLKKCASFVFGVSCLGALLALSVRVGQPVKLIFLNSLAVFFMVLVATWNATVVPMLNMLGFRTDSVLWGIVTAAAGAVSSVVLVVWLPTGSAWLFGQAIGMAIGAVGAHYALSRQAPHAVRWQITSPLFERQVVLKYFLPLALATALMWLQLSGYRFLVEWKWGLTQLGMLALGLQLPGQIWSLAESLTTQYFYPLFYRRISEKKSEKDVQLAVSDLINILGPVYLVLSGLIVAAVPYILKLLVDPRFSDAVNFVFFGCFIELCRILGNVLSNAAQATSKIKALVLPYALGSVTTFGLILFTEDSRFSITYVGLALVFGAMVMLVTMFVCMQKIVRLRLDTARWIAGGLTIMGMIAFLHWIPLPSSALAIIGMLAALVALTAIIVLALIKSSPAARRLLSVDLRVA